VPLKYLPILMVLLMIGVVTLARTLILERQGEEPEWHWLRAAVGVRYWPVRVALGVLSMGAAWVLVVLLFQLVG
jgi:hypothetical protein